MEYVVDKNAPDHPGHYSLGVSSNGFTFISGQLPIDWNGTGKLVCGGIEAQTRQALDNLVNALSVGGLGIDAVVKTTVLISDIKFWPAVDAIYKEYFKEHKPSRTVIPTMPLHYDALIEIEAIAENRG